MRTRAWSWVRAKGAELFGADLRALAAFRIVLALLALSDFRDRALNLTAHYTDQGVLPREALLQTFPNQWTFSLNLMSGDALVQAALFATAGVAGLALLVGYRTRLATMVVWVLLISVQVRNPLVLSGADLLLRMLFFWSLFLPLGAWWSVDRATGRVPKVTQTQYASCGTAGLLAQFALLYWTTGALKSGVEWHGEGSALYYALSLDQFATPFATWLLQFPELLRWLTWGALALELGGPFLLFSPIFTRHLRVAGVVAFALLHLGIRLTLSIGMFPAVAAFTMVCFLPGPLWDRLGRWWARALPTVRGWWAGADGRIAATNRALTELRARLAPLVAPLLADAPGLSRPPGDPVTWQGRQGWRGAVAAGAMWQARPGRREPAPMGLRASPLSDLLALFFIVQICFLNFAAIFHYPINASSYALGSYLQLDQAWGMFAPFPLKEDGWYVIPGQLRDGREVDLMPLTRGDFGQYAAVSWEKPSSVAATYKYERWRKYLTNLWQRENSGQRLYLGRYLCRTWNAHHTGTQQVLTFQIYYMLEVTQPDNRPGTPERVLTWEHNCFT